MKMLSSIALLQILCLVGLASGLIAKSENIILERPAKGEQGLLEKPDDDYRVHDHSHSSEEGLPVPEASWISRVWGRTLGRSDNGGFFTSLQPWWKGPNVCQSQEEHMVPANSGNEGDSSLFSFFMTTCLDSERAYKCTKQSKLNSTTIRVQTLTYECCLGYDRDTEATAGCQKKVELRDVVSTLRELNATKLADALGEANLGLALANGNMTVFAPTDDAMTSNNGEGDISVVVLETSDKMHFARDILSGHLVNTSKYYSSDDFEDEMVLPTLSDGASIRINIFSRPVPFATVNCARVTSSDHQTSNGYIHLIDRVLTPVKRTLWQMIQDDPQFSVFSSLVDDQLKRHLEDPNEHLTLLAFADDAFAKIPAEVRERIQSKNECFKDLLLYHILPHTICSHAIFNERGYVRNLASGVMNATRASDGTLAFAGRPLKTTDQMATNGVVHILDGVILVPQMLDVISAMELNGGVAAKFAATLKGNNIAKTISNASAITVFVPPSDSIQNLSRDDALYHVVHHKIMDNFRMNLKRPKTVPTEAGQNITIRFQYNFPPLFAWNSGNRVRLYVGCARAEKVANTCNGNIVYLNKPLHVPTQTVYDSLKSKQELSEFLSMINAAKLDELLRGTEFDGTVLAPTNEALARVLDADDKERLIENQQRLQRFVKQHILLGRKCCNQLTGNDLFGPVSYSTMAGTQTSAVGIDERNLRIGGAVLSECDVMATNGLVHIVDGVVASRRRWRWPSFWPRNPDLFDEY